MKRKKKNGCGVPAEQKVKQLSAALGQTCAGASGSGRAELRNAAQRAPRSPRGAKRATGLRKVSFLGHPQRGADPLRPVLPGQTRLSVKSVRS